MLELRNREALPRFQLFSSLLFPAPPPAAAASREIQKMPEGRPIGRATRHSSQSPRPAYDAKTGKHQAPPQKRVLGPVPPKQLARHIAEGSIPSTRGAADCSEGRTAAKANRS